MYGSCDSELPMTMAEKTFLTTRLAAKLAGFGVLRLMPK
jgi:hypothetical protein